MFASAISKTQVVPTCVPPVSQTASLQDSSLIARNTELTSFLIDTCLRTRTIQTTGSSRTAAGGRHVKVLNKVRIISRAGKELAADAPSITDYQHYGCNDYTVVEVSGSDDPLVLDTDRSYVVMRPRDLLPRDRRDHIVWLVKRGR